MMLALSLLLLFPTVWARYYEFSLASVANVIPPGNTNISLAGFQTFAFPGAVGTPGQTNTFLLSTLFPDVMAVINSSMSSTYVATGLTGNVSLPSYYGPTNTTGDFAYEYFNFGGLGLQRQGFINSISGVPMLGIGFGRAEDLGAPNFVESLYNQAQLAQKVVGVAFTDTTGTLYLGGYNASRAGGPFIQYPVQLNTEYWSYILTNVAVGSSSLGPNGLVAVDTSFPYSIVPTYFYKLLLQLVFPPTVTLVGIQENTYQYVTFDCSATTYPNLPNITFYLGGRPFVMTPYQYITYESPTVCLMNIAGSLPGYKAPAPYVLGSLAFGMTLSVFNIGNRTMSVASLSPN